MFQDLIINCPNQDHENNLRLICFDETCKANRLYCMQCIREGIHCSHPQHQYDLPILLEQIERVNQDCDNFVNRLKQIMDSVYQSFNELIGGIRCKYQRSKEQFVNLNSKQMNSFFEQTILFKTFQSKIEKLITQSQKTFQDQLKYFFQDLNIYFINFIFQLITLFDSILTKLQSNIQQCYPEICRIISKRV